MILYKFTNDPGRENAPISTGVLAKLQRDILTGKLKDGQKLTEQEICSEYRVSRTPVREALKQLEADGLVENILNRGAFVAGLTEQDYDDLYELRSLYETQAVIWAIERITDEGMEQLEENFEFMEFYTARREVDKMLAINGGFHQIIYEAAGNRMLSRTLSLFQTYLKYKNRVSARRSGYLHEVLEEHRMIFKAFKERDVRSGREAMERHINRAKEGALGHM